MAENHEKINFDTLNCLFSDFTITSFWKLVLGSTQHSYAFKKHILIAKQNNRYLLT